MHTVKFTTIIGKLKSIKELLAVAIVLALFNHKFRKVLYN